MKFIKNSIGLIAETAVGGAAISAIGNSGMQPGFKEASQSMVGIGLTSSAYKKFGKAKW